MTRRSYYQELKGDYSTPRAVSDALSNELIADYERYMSLRVDRLPDAPRASDLPQIEAENRQWWPARCEVIRRGRFDLMARENSDCFVYLCQDGPFIGDDPRGQKVTARWGALLCRPEVTLIWPLVQFAGEAIYFEWSTVDNVTYETTAAGNVTFMRRGHAGGCYLKTEHLAFSRDV